MRQPSARALEDVELKKKIQQIFTENKGRYGSPRIFKALRKQGYCISKAPFIVNGFQRLRYFKAALLP